VGRDEVGAVSPRPRRRAIVLAAVVAAVVVLVDLVTKWLADTRLPGAPVDLGIGRLQLSYNTGVAFSLGDGLPTWAVLAVAGAVTAGVLVAIVAGWIRPPAPAGLVLGGAVANIVDRAGDGAVTDFLWLGWFPTFNLADTAITLGALALLWASWRTDQHASSTGPARTAPSDEHGPPGERGAAPEQAPADLRRPVSDGTP
jgi:signal peptidase II